MEKIEDHARIRKLRSLMADWESFMAREGKDPQLAKAMVGLVGSHRNYELPFSDLRAAFEALFQIRRVFLFGGETEKAMRELLEFFTEE